MEEWVGVERESRGAALFPNTWACIRDLWGEKPHYRDLVAVGVWRKRRNRGNYSVTHVGFFCHNGTQLGLQGLCCSSFFFFYFLTKDKVTFRIPVFVQPL